MYKKGGNGKNPFHWIIRMPGRRRRRQRRKRTQKGGASLSTVRKITHKGPSLRDKIAEVQACFYPDLNLLLLLWDDFWEKQAFKGVSDDVKGYNRRR